MTLPSFHTLISRRERITNKLNQLNVQSSIPSVRGQCLALRKEVEKISRLIRIYYRRIK